MALMRNNTNLVRWNRHLYMTDLELMYAPWFRLAKHVDFYNYIDSLHGFYSYRWGDHAIRTLQLKLFLDPGVWHEEASKCKQEDKSICRGVIRLTDFPYGHQKQCNCPRGLKCEKPKSHWQDGGIDTAQIRRCLIAA